MKKLISLVLCAIMTLSVFTACGDDKTPSAPNPHNDPEAAPAVTYTAEEITTAMTVGWNLGNTLDAPDGEESWGQPLTTKDMIDKLAELGFKTIRIPTSWGKHTSGAPDYTIDEKWMDRVQEIVDWAMDNDMFVILNSHHDNDFYYPSAENHDEAVNYMTKIWTQVAERFKDYDQHLIFESMNEPRLTGTQYEWNFDSNAKECLEAAKTILDCNQACVDAVRAAGGAVFAHGLHLLVGLVDLLHLLLGHIGQGRIVIVIRVIFSRQIAVSFLYLFVGSGTGYAQYLIGVTHHRVLPFLLRSLSFLFFYDRFR